MNGISKITANQLTKQTIKMLSYCGFELWRQNNGGVYDAKFSGYRKGSSTPGISDILGYHKKTGKIIAIEIKAGKDKLSIEQERFLKGITKAGGYSHVVRTLDDITELINIYGKKSS
jgi:hypothetical protein